MKTPEPGAILTREQVAEWLQITPRLVNDLGIPTIALSRKTKRYDADDVRAWLAARKAA